MCIELNTIPMMRGLVALDIIARVLCLISMRMSCVWLATYAAERRQSQDTLQIIPRSMS